MSDGLSKREYECVQRAAAFLSDKEIAAELGISPKTVRNTLGRAYRKLGVTTRKEAAARLGQGVPRAPIPITPTPELAPDNAVPGDLTSAINPAQDTWLLPPPPSRRRRPLTIFGFLVVASLISMMVVLTILTTIDTAASRAPPNAIQAPVGSKQADLR